MAARIKTMALCATMLALGGCAGGMPEYRMVAGVKPIEQMPVDKAMEKGRAMLAARQYGLAAEAFRTVLRQDSRSAEAYNGLAIAYDGVGRADLARQNFELALAHAPADPRYARNYAAFTSRHGGEAPTLAPRAALAALDTPMPESLPAADKPPLRELETVLAEATLPPPSAALPEARAPIINTPDAQDEELALAPIASPAFIGPSAVLPAEPVELEHSVAHAARPPEPQPPVRLALDLDGLAAFGAAPAYAQLALVTPSDFTGRVMVATPNEQPILHPVAGEIQSGVQWVAVEPVRIEAPVPTPKPASMRMAERAVPSEPKGPVLERVSLGEVRLVTRPSLPKRHDDSREIVVVALASREEKQRDAAALEAAYWTAVTKAVVRANLRDAWRRDGVRQNVSGPIALLDKKIARRLRKGTGEA